jgi:hypothetical protein
MPPYKHIHVVINPASGKGEPVLKDLADVCRQYEVEWDVSITRKYGNATQQARDALARGVNLVVSSWATTNSLASLRPFPFASGIYESASRVHPPPFPNTCSLLIHWTSSYQGEGTGVAQLDALL